LIFFPEQAFHRCLITEQERSDLTVFHSILPAHNYKISIMYAGAGHALTLWR